MWHRESTFNQEHSSDASRATVMAVADTTVFDSLLLPGQSICVRCHEFLVSLPTSALPAADNGRFETGECGPLDHSACLVSKHSGRRSPYYMLLGRDLIHAARERKLAMRVCYAIRFCHFSSRSCFYSTNTNAGDRRPTTHQPYPTSQYSIDSVLLCCFSFRVVGSR